MNKNKECFSCGSKIKSTGFKGDWEVFECTGESCNLIVNRPVSNPSGKGYTMQDLGELSNIDWTE